MLFVQYIMDQVKRTTHNLQNKTKTAYLLYETISHQLLISFSKLVVFSSCSFRYINND